MPWATYTLLTLQTKPQAWANKLSKQAGPLSGPRSGACLRERAGQRAEPFLSECRDECIWMEMNGTRNINSSYLYVLYPCGDLFFFFFTLPRFAHMVVFAPPMSLALRVTTVHLVKSINNTKDRHADTKLRLYLCPPFIFLRVDTIDTCGICLTDLTHVHQLNQNQRLTIDCLQAKSIFWCHFMRVNHHHIFT